MNAPLDIHDGKGHLQVGEVATGAGPPNFGPDNTAMGVGFEYPPIDRPEDKKQTPKECWRSIFGDAGEGCKADDADDAAAAADDATDVDAVDGDADGSDLDGFGA